jgi:hypothetical protein
LYSMPLVVLTSDLDARHARHGHKSAPQARTNR